MHLLQRLRALAASALVAAAAGLALPAHAQKAEAVRPEVGKPLQEAESLARTHHYKEAMAKVSQADAAANKSPGETVLIQRVRGSIAAAAGDNETAIRSFEAVINSGRVSGRDLLQMVQAVAVAYYKNKDYAKAAQWTQRYFKEGGTEPAMRTMLLQSYFLASDCASVSKMLGPATSEEASARKPTEEELQILANCYLRQKDTGGYVSAIERLVVYYPKKEYWTDLLSRVQKKPGFSDRLSLHVYRLRLATGNFTAASDYMEMAQLALQAGVPAEAKMVMDKGYAAKALGVGKEADRQARLRDLVAKSLADSQRSRAQEEKDALAAAGGDELVKLGMNYVFEGKGDKGVGLIEKGIKKGGLKRPEDARLALGEAELFAGQKARAVQTLRGVHGADGTADIARLWVLHART